MITKFDDILLGKTIWKIERQYDANDEVFCLIFHLDDLSRFDMYDEEYGTGNDVSVRLYDIAGDLSDLVGQPLVMAEMSKNTEEDVDPSQNWSFYRFATQKGYVTLRWIGQSNGYYSEEVSIGVYDDRINADHEDYLAFCAQREKTTIVQSIDVTDVSSRAMKKM